MKNIFGKNFSAQLVVFLAIVTIIGGTMKYVYLKKVFHVQQDKSIDNIGAVISPTLTQLVWNVDDIATKTFIDSVQQVYKLSHMELVSESEKEIYKSNVVGNKEVLKDFKLLREGTHIGNVRIWYNYDQTIGFSTQFLYYEILTAVFAFLTISGGVYWINLVYHREIIATSKKLEETNVQLEIEMKERQALQKKIVDTARQAGMAEVSTGVLHNIGNVLNSVNVSSNLISEKLDAWKFADGHQKAMSMIKSKVGGLDAFLQSDPKGKMLLDYMDQLGIDSDNERKHLSEEVKQLAKKIDHIKSIVNVHQSFAKVTTVNEKVSLTELLDDVLQINMDAMQKASIQLIREEDSSIVPFEMDRAKVMQVLVNFVNNATYAVNQYRKSDKAIIVRTRWLDLVNISIDVIDNGVGISKENLDKIFVHGFTTKKDGHGFGLHSAYFAAKQMGGALRVTSDGEGRGATFSLELPVKKA